MSAYFFSLVAIDGAAWYLWTRSKWIDCWVLQDAFGSFYPLGSATMDDFLDASLSSCLSLEILDTLHHGPEWTSTSSDSVVQGSLQSHSDKTRCTLKD